MSEQPKTPEQNGNGDGKAKWEELGFESEDAMFAAAKDAGDLRGKIADAEAKLEKERSARTKTDSEFMRQSNEIGEMRKKLAEFGADQPAAPSKEKKDVKPEDVLDSISEEEASVLDGVLNDPKNADLKKRVALGGTSAMAEFVQAYRAEAPVDLSVSLFSGLKQKKADTVQKSSIAKAVKDLFAQHNAEEKNNLPAGIPGSASANRTDATQQQKFFGGVDASFFIKKT